MAPITLGDTAIRDLRALLDNAVSDPQNGLPNATIVLLGDGKRTATELFDYSAAGEDSSIGDIHWMASCTKLVTTISCMQLVESGALGLDDPDQIEAICPEFKGLQVLQDDGILVDKKSKITLRMLLTHTAGFGYSFLNRKLEKYNEFSCQMDDFLQPLVNQPGARFEYGISIDWVGIIIQRVSNMTLNEYFHQYVFQPLGIKDVTLVPPQKMVDRLVGMWQREKDGQITRIPQPLARMLDTEQGSGAFQSGGGGIFGNIREYGKLLSTLLNDGTSPQTGRQILSPATVQEMFRNQLEDPNFARHSLPAVKPNFVYPANELYPLTATNAPQGWGLSFMISPGLTGRSTNTVHWSGISNIFWWCDKEQGVAGIVASQMLPFVDPQVGKLWFEAESLMFSEIQKGRVGNL